MSCTWTEEFKILDGGPFPAILGFDFLQRTQMTLNLRAKTFGFAFAPTKVGSFGVDIPVGDYEPYLHELCVKVSDLILLLMCYPSSCVQKY